MYEAMLKILNKELSEVIARNEEIEQERKELKAKALDLHYRIGRLETSEMKRKSKGFAAQCMDRVMADHFGMGGR